MNRAPSVKALHPSYRSQLYRTASQRTQKDKVKDAVDAAIGIRRRGTTKKEQEENAEKRKKAIEEKKQIDLEEDLEGGFATLRAKLGIKSKKDKEKDKKDKEEKKDKEKRKSKVKEASV